MLDLFGEQITAPRVKVKRETNSAQGFAEFWQAWPKGPRKVAKQQCLDKWARYDCADCWKHIVAHVEWMKRQQDWQKDQGAFIPQPLTYLNQQRWVDWEEPVIVVKKSALDEIKAHKGSAPSEEIRAKMRELLGRK